MDLAQLVADDVLAQGVELVGAQDVAVRGATLLSDPVAGQAHLDWQHTWVNKNPHGCRSRGSAHEQAPRVSAFQRDRAKGQLTAFERHEAVTHGHVASRWHRWDENRYRLSGDAVERLDHPGWGHAVVHAGDQGPGRLATCELTGFHGPGQVATWAPANHEQCHHDQQDRGDRQDDDGRVAQQEAEGADDRYADQHSLRAR